MTDKPPPQYIRAQGFDAAVLEGLAGQRREPLTEEKIIAMARLLEKGEATPREQFDGGRMIRSLVYACKELEAKLNELQGLLGG
jgi:hypothetical protein